MNKRLVRGVVAAAACTTLLSFGGCFDKQTEQFKDAKVEDRNTDPAAVGSMPNGFSNFATKCDHGHRVYVLFHKDGHYGAITVVQDDECMRAYKRAEAR